MIKRSISGIVLVLLLGFVLMQGGYFLDLSVVLLSVIAIFELARVCKENNIHIHRELLVLQVVFLFFFHGQFSFLLVSVIFLFLTSGIYAIARNGITDMVYTVFASIYIVVNFAFFYFLNGDARVLLVFIFSWISDTCAYFTGVFFGKHPLCPAISPKKTIEGSIGGMIGSALLALLFSYYWHGDIIWYYAGFGLVGSAISQSGDLIASMFKRQSQIKDYGNIIPGHGGILDRFDSILFVLPVVYLITLMK
ncbi:phosphatidate cytidylyltransferase [Gottschalkiaceae bacterium SANA]|nr:phosphatidate cytidylyltransferase [Gottschalkiaceae bacterium SANA]